MKKIVLTLLLNLAVGMSHAAYVVGSIIPGDPSSAVIKSISGPPNTTTDLPYPVSEKVIYYTVWGTYELGSSRPVNAQPSCSDGEARLSYYIGKSIPQANRISETPSRVVLQCGFYSHTWSVVTSPPPDPDPVYCQVTNANESFSMSSGTQAYRSTMLLINCNVRSTVGLRIEKPVQQTGSGVKVSLEFQDGTAEIKLPKLQSASVVVNIDVKAALSAKPGTYKVSSAVIVSVP